MPRVGDVPLAQRTARHTFELPDGRQVLIYLMQGTLWQIGTFNAENGTFTAEPPRRGAAAAAATAATPGVAPDSVLGTTVAEAASGHEQGLGSCGLTDAARTRQLRQGLRSCGKESARKRRRALLS